LKEEKLRKIKEVLDSLSTPVIKLKRYCNNSIQFFIHLRAELNSRWPITESARNIKQTKQKTHKKTKEK
jgi:hypothetical protein